MSEKHKEKDITITRKISVDECIAEEINKLNNEDNISTLSSCCGHGASIGYIVVTGDDIQKMINLGYETRASKYFDHDLICGDRIVICGFKPKSKCMCV